MTRAEHTFTNEPIVVHRTMFAVQIATSPGADVTGVCHTTKVDLVRSLGRRPRHRLIPAEWLKRAADAAPDTPPTCRHVRRHTTSRAVPTLGRGVELSIDRAIQDTRSVVYPLHGLDPHDPRD